MHDTSVYDFEVDVLEGDVAIILTCQRAQPQKYFVEITTLSLRTGISDLELVSRLPEGLYTADCVVCGGIVAVHFRMENEVLLINWRTSCRVMVSKVYEIVLVPGHLLAITRTGTCSEDRVALSPFALFECWEPNDSVEPPSTPVVSVADLPFLPDTFSLTREPYHIPLKSIWVYESPFERGRFTVWLHGFVNGVPAVLSFEFVKHATRAAMPTQIYPSSMSLSGHTYAYCVGYAKDGIFAPFPVSKGSARRQIVDFGFSAHMSSFSGALTYLTNTELVILYYD
ncbi:hypothetical protein DFH08DRAFT_34900 [Mycena albidolilacea]|uniref:Uncharacterized protein n=1 Tax=Mycena albidolilacea TaxID=1033008 RepID=A0AAD7AVN7_9AGAR|nr:hypothetical protein DFH08DRAFT_34900 [Mycena albidolilacea]